MKIGICTFEMFHGRKDLGSSRIRGHWLVKNWKEAKLFKQGEKYDVVIYQKAYFIEHAKVFKGIKILDICDPDWLHWAYRTKEMIELCDAITTSTEALAITLRQFTDKPVLCIPDRVDLELFKERKIHEGDAKRVSWYGYSDNYDMIKPVINQLKKNNLDLLVISNGQFNVSRLYQDKIEVKNLKWKEKSVNENILKSDFVINPRGNNGKWKFKSNNKTLTSWAIDMPVAHNVEELKRFINCDERIKEVNKRRKELIEKWDIKYSIKQYQQLIEEINNK